jgi:hypothetical protein
LRFTIVCLAALLFNQPEWVQEYRPEEKPSVAVLWDASTSMETRDCLPAGQTASNSEIVMGPSRNRSQNAAKLSSRTTRCRKTPLLIIQ